MGNLITETPLSEVTATMEALDHLGVGRDDLKRFRKASWQTKNEVLKHLKGGIDDVIDCHPIPTGIPAFSTPASAWRHVEFHDRQEPFQWNDGKNVRLVEFPSWLRQRLSKRCDVSQVLNLIQEHWNNEIVLNANVLEHLLTRRYLIPWDWKGREVLFLGTIYRECHVRGLCDHSPRDGTYCVWHECTSHIDAFFGDNTYVALRAK